jgi:hypothetical protein
MKYWLPRLPQAEEESAESEPVGSGRMVTYEDFLPKLCRLVRFVNIFSRFHMRPRV